MLTLLLACNGGNTNDSSDSDVAVEPSAPTAPTIAIQPPSPVTSDDLVCAITVESTDADGDDITYTVDWLKNNQPYEASGDTIPAAETTASEGWMCTVTATDSTGLSADPVSDNVGIGNSPPGVPEAAIDPPSPTTDDDILCYVTVDATDPDGHDVTYKYTWVDTNGEVDNGFAENTMSASKTSPGQALACQVNAFDGVAYGDGVLVEFTVQ